MIAGEDGVRCVSQLCLSDPLKACVWGKRLNLKPRKTLIPEMVRLRRAMRACRGYAHDEYAAMLQSLVDDLPVLIPNLVLSSLVQ